VPVATGGWLQCGVTATGQGGFADFADHTVHYRGGHGREPVDNRNSAPRADRAVNADFLVLLDDLRRVSGNPSQDGRVVREMSPDGSECRIVFSDCASAELDGVIGAEQARAAAAGYTLEWKTYGHDVPAELPARLLAAGFEPDDQERVLVLPVTDRTIASFGDSPYQIRRVDDTAGLADYADIAREIGRQDPEDEKEKLAAELRDGPDGQSVYIAYVDGTPAASGRVYFTPGSPCAELAGGRTRTTHRRHGLFTALVASRLREAKDRGHTHVFVDALPTSDPTLTKRGFQFVTTTTPYVYEPDDSR
jgi:GNAT superfamily N-acetyltransferase